eukprot:sb/3479523/
MYLASPLSCLTVSPSLYISLMCDPSRSQIKGGVCILFPLSLFLSLFLTMYAMPLFASSCLALVIRDTYESRRHIDESRRHIDGSRRHTDGSRRHTDDRVSHFRQICIRYSQLDVTKIDGKFGKKAVNSECVACFLKFSCCSTRKGSILARSSRCEVGNSNVHIFLTESSQTLIIIDYIKNRTVLPSNLTYENTSSAVTLLLGNRVVYLDKSWVVHFLTCIVPCRPFCPQIYCSAGWQVLGTKSGWPLNRGQITLISYIGGNLCGA